MMMAQPGCRRAIRRAILVSQSQQWLTERFAYTPQVCRFLAGTLPCCRRGTGIASYTNGLAAATLTMIKIVLIESISFEPPSQ
jgi:hypothetical protein